MHLGIGEEDGEEEAKGKLGGGEKPEEGEEEGGVGQAQEGEAADRGDHARHGREDDAIGQHPAQGQDQGRRPMMNLHMVSHQVQAQNTL